MRLGERRHFDGGETDFAPVAHTEIGEYARAKGVERLFAMGELAKLAVESFGPGAEGYPDAQALAAAVKQALVVAGPGPGVRVLIKGSRVNRLERVVDVLVHGSIQTTGGH